MKAAPHTGQGLAHHREKARLAAARLAVRGFDIECINRDSRVGFKAGALAAGLERAKGEFILIFDADFVPPPGILRQSIEHFTDPQIGMVQMRWSHLNRPPWTQPPRACLATSDP